MRAYPRKARDMKMSGDATIDCEVTLKGTLDHCLVVSETPPKFDFGDGALRMASDFTFRPATRFGVPVPRARVKVPIEFQLR